MDKLILGLNKLSIIVKNDDVKAMAIGINENVI